MKDFLDDQKKIIISIVLVLLIFFVKVLYDNTYVEKSEDIAKEEENLQYIKLNEDNKDDKLALNAAVDQEIFVHVGGRVKNPGLVKLNSDARVIDAINKAGGMYDDADIDSINLAKKLEDEEKIYVASIEEQLNPTESTSKNELININRAQSDQLQTLPGIGPKMAEKIINYRQDNSFKNIEDIMQVPGIGEKKFEEIKDYICAN
jgi:competence protein ComEA